MSKHLVTVEVILEKTTDGKTRKRIDTLKVSPPDVVPIVGDAFRGGTVMSVVSLRENVNTDQDSNLLLG